MGGGGHVQLLRRIPRINFPNRRLPPPPTSPPPDTASQTKVTAFISRDKSFFSNSKTSSSPGGKASLQPMRTPVSEEEIESILLGGCS